MSSNDHSPAIRAADVLIQDPTREEVYEPATTDEARVAVARLGHRIQNSPGLFKQMIDGAKKGAETLSSDRLQVLSEVVQNADDVQASEVRVVLEESRLLIHHDGRPATLREILGLAAPFLSTKRLDAEATGRFGIGLSTMAALGSGFTFHSGVYHVRFDDVPAPSADPHPLGEDSTHTSFEVNLETPLLPKAVEDWVDSWQDAALLFLKSVRRLEVTTNGGTRALEVLPTGPSAVVDGTESTVLVRTPTGPEWLVTQTLVEKPEGLERRNKHTDDQVPVGVALPLGQTPTGALHAGLPVVASALPVRLNAQFDPVLSRQDLADTPWNHAMLGLLGPLWARSIIELARARPAAIWGLIPIEEPDQSGTRLVEAAENRLLAEARSHVGPQLQLPVEGGHQPVAELCYEEPELTGLLTEEELAHLSGRTEVIPESGESHHVV